MKKRLMIYCFFSLVIFVGTSHAKINRKTVETAWTKISSAANFERLAVNYEKDEEPNAWIEYDDEGNYSLHFTNGLMKILENEEEAAGVLGHELGHIILGHYNSFALNDTVRAIMETNLERADDLTVATGNINMDLKESKFSREQETEADNYGIKISVEAGYGSWGLYNAMKRFEINGYATGKNGFNSHPASSERLKNLSDEAKKAKKIQHKKSKTKNNFEEVDELADILMLRK